MNSGQIRLLLARRQLSDNLGQYISDEDFILNPLYETYFEATSVGDSTAKPNWSELEFYGEATFGEAFPSSPANASEGAQVDTKKVTALSPPINAEYLLYLFLRKEEREVALGDLIEDYNKMVERFGERRARLWFYKQVVGSLFPLVRRAVLRVVALAWIGRVLRRLIS